MYSEDVEEFMMKVLRKSGLSTDGTYLPACIHPCLTKDPRHDLEEGRKEAEMVMFGAVQVGADAGCLSGACSMLSAVWL